MADTKIVVHKVKDLDVGVDKATRRFLVRFHIGPGATGFFSLSPETAAELSAAIVKRLSKLVVKH